MRSTTTLDEFAERHLSPLGITLQQAEREALSLTDEQAHAYSTGRSLEALRRLRARATGTPTPVAAVAPVLVPTDPTTIADDDGEHMVVHTRESSTRVPDTELLDHLREQQIATRGEAHRSLIIDTPATLIRLRRIVDQGRHQPVAAAVLDWWLQRSEHPGSGACYVATSAARARWVTGELTEDQLDTWARWLALPQTCPAARAHAVVHAAAAGTTLEGLLDCHTSDSYSWQRLNRRNLTRHHPESRRDAAIGLTTRNQAAEHYQSLRLGDPLVAQQAVREGHLTHAVITDLDRAEATVRSTSGACRLRPGAKVQAWAGLAQDAGTAPLALRTAVVTHVGISADSTHLQIVLSDLAGLRSGTAVGDTITLRPAPVDPFQQARLRTQYVRRLQDGRNWLTRPGTPPLTRREVPLDVVVAAADD